MKPASYDRYWFVLTTSVLHLGLVLCTQPARAQDGQRSSDGRLAEVGQLIFFDATLSNPKGQSCSSCHSLQSAFADGRRVSPGAVPGRVGTRNAPTLMYAALIPGIAYEDVLLPDRTEIFNWEGGLFHDGRARDLFDQVQQPFFDDHEMNLRDEGELVRRLRSASYADALEALVGQEYWQDERHVAYIAYRSLVEFLKEPIFRPFDAPIDDYLAGNTAALTKQQLRGLEVFRGAGNCASCHLLTPTNWKQPLLSDFAYDNLGVPSRGRKDPGLAAQTKQDDDLGKFRAPSLRNVALTAPYMHNGAIEKLSEVLEFYNKRDLEPKRWGKTDYPMTVNRADLGDLKLTAEQLDDLLALMTAFTDRSLTQVKANRPLPKASPKVAKTAEIKDFFPDWTHRLHPVFKERGHHPDLIR